MLIQVITFLVAIAVLLVSAQFFTGAAEQIGKHFKMPSFVVGVFIVGIGTSLPELVSAILSVRQSVSEIVPGNVMGSNISNVLLITGLVAVFNRKEIKLTQSYIFIHLHYLIGAFFIFTIISFDGEILWYEAIVGLLAFIIYSLYLIHDDKKEHALEHMKISTKEPFPVKQALIILACSLGIYLGADYTISSLSAIAGHFQIAPSIIALTVLSIGTTLPELAVNITAIRQGKAEMAVGNVLGSSIFNSLVVPAIASFFGSISVPEHLITFSLPVMLGSGLFFYLLTHDKRISPWEGSLFVFIYILFILKIAIP